MKTGNENKRTKRKEIQFSETEYAAVEKKANAARLSVAAANQAQGNTVQ